MSSLIIPMDTMATLQMCLPIQRFKVLACWRRLVTSALALVNPGTVVSYQYDNLGRTTQRQINDPGTPNTVTWSYDQMSRVTSETNTLGTFNYAYVDDLHNGTTNGSSKGTTRLASISYPNGQVTNFSWYGPNQTSVYRE